MFTRFRRAGSSRPVVWPCRSMAGVLSALLLFFASSAFAEGLEKQVTLDIPAQQLDTALMQFAKQTDLQVMLATKSVAGKTTAGVKGTLSAGAALAILLQGSGMSFSVKDGTVTVVPERGKGAGMVNHESIRLAQADQTSNSGSKDREGSNADQDTVEIEGRHKGRENKVKDDSLEEITVTGSHIRGVSPASPVIVIDRDEIDRDGYTVLGDVIRSLPQNFSGGNNPQVAVGSAPGLGNGSLGGTAPNLRGLGPTSTLTLVDGHRLAEDQDSGAVDVSLIPLDAVERIEIVTDGASAAYGSDAVAGVVNIVLKKNYEGAQSAISYGGAPEGGGRETRISQLLGTTWSSGGAMLAYENDRQDAVYASQRPFTSTVLSPYTLLPESSRNSVFLSGHQDFSSSVSGFVEGLYSSRDNELINSYAPTDGYDSAVSSRAYTVNFGVDARLPHHWELHTVGEVAEQLSRDELYTFAPAVSTQAPAYLEQYAITGRTSSLEIDGDGSLTNLPAGPLRLAVGGGYRRETFDEQYVGIQVFDDGGRNIGYVFSELAIPLYASDRLGLKRLDLSVSGRYEHYSDFGSSSVPKIGITYVPVDGIKMRATWGKSFVAPTLTEILSASPVGISQIPDPESPTGVSNVFVRYGGNSQLTPETATSWTAGIDLALKEVEGLQISATYFDIDYKNLISQLPDFFTALSDPANAAFVVRSPSPQVLQNLIDQAGGVLMNDTGAPYNPSTIAAVVDYRYLNVSRQYIDGMDLQLLYRPPAIRGLSAFSNLSYLEIRQQVAPQSPESELAGTSFNPPRFRGRVGLEYAVASLTATGTANYLGRESNTYAPGAPEVRSWTTIDTNLAYAFGTSSALAGVRASVAVINLFNRVPPYVQFNTYINGVNYDVLNATPMGRFLTLQLSKKW